MPLVPPIPYTNLFGLEVESLIIGSVYVWAVEPDHLWGMFMGEGCIDHLLNGILKGLDCLILGLITSLLRACCCKVNFQVVLVVR